MLTHLVDTGANASAEEAEEALEDAEVKVNNIVNSFRLQSTSFDKKSYLTYLKGNPPPNHLT
jgi:adenylate cyclase class IV